MDASHHQHTLQLATMRHRLRAALFFAALIALSPGDGIAQLTGDATPIENVTNIRAQPLALLAKFPDAGPDMARFVAQQLTQQPGAVDAMLSIVKDTSPQQASAMGAGMVRAVRNLSAKQPAAARAISEKIMRTDNKWLTTTFVSLGPRYQGNEPFVAPAMLPPRELVTMDMGTGMGAAWRVGPAENQTLTNWDPNSNDENKKCPYNSYYYMNGGCRALDGGMIVAIIKSDAPHNGAVSTSPTI